MQMQSSLEVGISVKRALRLWYLWKRGKSYVKNGRTMSVWVGGLEGGCSKACLFRFSILIYVFWSITCMVFWSLGLLSARPVQLKN